MTAVKKLTGGNECGIQHMMQLNAPDLPSYSANFTHALSILGPVSLRPRYLYGTFTCFIIKKKEIQFSILWDL